MTWVKIDDNFADHPKFVARTDTAIASWLRALAYSSRFLTDGVIPKAAQRVIGPDQAVDELVDAGLFIDLGEEWQIHDYTQHQRSREEVNKIRAQSQERVNKFRQRKRNGVTPEPESETETDTDNSSSQSYPQATSGLVSPEDETRIEAALTRLVDQRTNSNTRVRNPAAYKQKIRLALRSDGTIDRIADLVATYPTAPPDVIANAIDGDGRNLNHYR